MERRPEWNWQLWLGLGDPMLWTASIVHIASYAANNKKISRNISYKLGLQGNEITSPTTATRIPLGRSRVTWFRTVACPSFFDQTQQASFMAIAIGSTELPAWSSKRHEDEGLTTYSLVERIWKLISEQERNLPNRLVDIMAYNAFQFRVEFDQ